MALLNLSQINKEKNFIENNYLLQWKKQTVFGMDRMYASDLYYCADREKFRPFGPTKIPREIDTTHAIAQVPRTDGRGAERERGERREDRGRALPLFVPREIQRVRGTNPGCHANGMRKEGRPTAATAHIGNGSGTDTRSLGLPIGIRECHFGGAKMYMIYNKLQPRTKI